MLQTLVTFELNVPVTAPSTPKSFELAELVEQWHDVRGVENIEIIWKSLPPLATDELRAQVELFVTITGESAVALRTLYSRLTEEASTPFIRLCYRDCNSREMFADEAKSVDEMRCAICGTQDFTVMNAASEPRQIPLRCYDCRTVVCFTCAGRFRDHSGIQMLFCPKCQSRETLENAIEH